MKDAMSRISLASFRVSMRTSSDGPTMSNQISWN